VLREAPCHDQGQKAPCPDACLLACHVLVAPEAAVVGSVEIGASLMTPMRSVPAARPRPGAGASASTMTPRSDENPILLKSENHHETYLLDRSLHAAGFRHGRLRRRAGRRVQGRPGLLRARRGLLQRRSLLLI
jgi:hypothetical protein